MKYKTKSMFVIPIVLVKCLWRALCNVCSSIVSFCLPVCFVLFLTQILSLALSLPLSSDQEKEKRRRETEHVTDWLQEASFCETSELEYNLFPFLMPRLLGWRREMKLLASHQLNGSLPSYFLSAPSPLAQPSPPPPSALPSLWSSSMLGWAVNTNYTKSPLLLPGPLVLLFCQMVEANV